MSAIRGVSSAMRRQQFALNRWLDLNKTCQEWSPYMALPSSIITCIQKIPVRLNENFEIFLSETTKNRIEP